MARDEGGWLCSEQGNIGTATCCFVRFLIVVVCSFNLTDDDQCLDLVDIEVKQNDEDLLQYRKKVFAYVL